MALRLKETPRVLSGVRALLSGIALIALPALSGCHSAYVQADIVNSSGQPISLLEVDYPSASFGTEALPANSSYQYRFKILGSGSTKVLWTDAHRKDHSVSGPTLHEGQQGTLQITIMASSANWRSHLEP